MKKVLLCLCFLWILAAPPHMAGAINLRPDQEANFDGLNFMKAKEYAKAIEKFTLAIESVPKERRDSLATYHSNRGVAYRRIQNLKDSLADLDKAVAFDPDNPSVWSQRANTFYDLQRYAEAENDASKAILINPNEFVALNARALAESALERYEDAVSDYTRALALKQDPVVYNNRAGAYRDQKLWNQALSDYETALQIEPTNKESIFGRATIQWHMKRFDAVISGTQSALNDNDSAMLRVLRGMAQQSKAHWKEAVEEYDVALTKEPALPLASALRELANQQLPIDFSQTKKRAAGTAQPPLPQAALPQAGEIRLQGVLKSVDITQSRLVMDATAFTLPTGKTATLSPAKQKEVVWNPQTHIVPFVGSQSVSAMEEIKIGATIWVVGADKGAGTSLVARWLGSTQQLPEENGLLAQEPKLPTQAVGHPRFIKKDGVFWSAGSAFLARWDEGDPILLTAHHLLGPAGGLEKEIPPTQVAEQIKTVRFNDFLNRFLPGNGTQVVPLAPIERLAPGDESGDMTAFRITPEVGKQLQTLPLAIENPVVNEPLWLVGRALGEKRPGAEGMLLYPARAVLSEAKRLVIQMKEPVAGRGFSGAPVVNAKGEVVGLMLSSSEWLGLNLFVCNPVSALRARLKGP